VFPYLQAPAADALAAAQRARGATMGINSALRTLPQQFLLYRWYQQKRCGIRLAAPPGKSNHESAVALDIGDYGAWRPAMQAKGFRWLGASDPVHFDYVGEGRVDLGGLSVLAFQKLWNRNHPEDPIAEDSAYGDDTEKRLALAPVGGFAKGADCSANVAPTPATPPPSSGEDDAANRTQGARSNAGDDGGCAVAVRSRFDSRSCEGPLSFALLFGLVALRRRRVDRSLRDGRR
jgi:hypothetical protein